MDTTAFPANLCECTLRPPCPQTGHFTCYRHRTDHLLPTGPNILLVVADDLGYSDLGCFGGEIKTPNLDALASNGVRLAQFYSTARCCPSRASILTGQYSHRVGVGHMVTDLGQPGYKGRLSENAATIWDPAEYLRLPQGSRPRSYAKDGFYGTDALTDHALDFIEDARGTPNR